MPSTALRPLGRAAVAAGWPVVSVILLTGCSRILGLAREGTVSALYGVGQITDAFFAAQQVPVLLSSFLFGAFTLAVVPHYGRALLDGSHHALLRSLASVVTKLCAVATIVAIPSSLVVSALSGIPLSVSMAPCIVIALSVVPSGWWALGVAVLHSEGAHVRATALLLAGPAGMVLTLVGGAAAAPGKGDLVLPSAYLAGATFAGILGLRILRRRSTGVEVSRPVYGRLWRDTASSGLENVGFAVNQLSTVVVAGWTGAGAIAVNAFASRMAMTALGGLVSPIGQIAQVRATSRGLRHAWPLAAGALVIALFAAAVLYMLRDPIVSLVYQRGAFGPEEASVVSALLVPYSAYLFVVAANQIAARLFMVVERMPDYTRVMIVAYAGATVMKPLAVQHAGLEGVIWTMVIAEGVAVVVSWARLWAVARRGQQ